MRHTVRLLERHESNAAGELVLLDEDLAAVMVAHGKAAWPGAAPAGSEYVAVVRFSDVTGERVQMAPNLEEEAAE